MASFTTMRLVVAAVVLLLPLSGFAASAPQAQAFQRLDNCRLIANDGKEWIFRL